MGRVTVPQDPQRTAGAPLLGEGGPAALRDPTAGVPPPRRPRGGGTTRDIVVSLAVMALVIGGFLLVSGLWQNIRIGAGKPAARSVDVSASAVALGSTARFPLATPTGLPAGWAGRAATLRNGLVWHLTYVTPATRYAALDQSAGSGTALVEELLPQRRAAGTVSLPSGTWQRFTAAATADGADRSGLVQQRAGSTVVVSGTAGADELGVLAGSLPRG